MDAEKRGESGSCLGLFTFHGPGRGSFLPPHPVQGENSEPIPQAETAFYDAVVRIWLCSLKPPAVAKAMRNKEQAVIDAFAWAEKQGFTSLNWEPISKLYKQLNQEIRASTGARSTEPDADPNSGGPHVS